MRTPLIYLAGLVSGAVLVCWQEQSIQRWMQRHLPGQQITVNVYGAGDPRAVSQQVLRDLRDL